MLANAVFHARSATEEYSDVISKSQTYIAAAGVDRVPVFDAIAEAIAALGSDDRALLGIDGIVYIEPRQYMAVPNPPDD